MHDCAWISYACVYIFLHTTYIRKHPHIYKGDGGWGYSHLWLPGLKCWNTVPPLQLVQLRILLPSFCNTKHTHSEVIFLVSKITQFISISFLFFIFFLFFSFSFLNSGLLFGRRYSYKEQYSFWFLLSFCFVTFLFLFDCCFSIFKDVILLNNIKTLSQVHFTSLKLVAHLCFRHT